MIVVTGLMRSGTSPLARMLHQGGVVMGTEMLFPVGLSGPEYEDLAVQRPLGQWLMEKQPPHWETRVAFLRAYIHIRRIPGAGPYTRPELRQGWGFKTPFVAPYLGELKEACHLESEPLQLVFAARWPDDTLESLKRCLAHLTDDASAQIYLQLVKLQERIGDALSEFQESERILDRLVTVQIDEIWDQPELVRERLNVSLGIELPESATRGIGKGRF